MIKIALILLMVLSGCQLVGRTNDRTADFLGHLSGLPQVDLVWTSELGRHCMSKCAKKARRCLDDARNEGRAQQCRAGTKQCLSACPDLRPPKCASEGLVSSTADCWRNGFCGRGECFINHGCCVRR
jgi:hypothetical protein